MKFRRLSLSGIKLLLLVHCPGPPICYRPGPQGPPRRLHNGPRWGSHEAALGGRADSISAVPDRMRTTLGSGRHQATGVLHQRALTLSVVVAHASEIQLERIDRRQSRRHVNVLAVQVVRILSANWSHQERIL